MKKAKVEVTSDDLKRLRTLLHCEYGVTDGRLDSAVCGAVSLCNRTLELATERAERFESEQPGSFTGSGYEGLVKAYIVALKGGSNWLHYSRKYKPKELVALWQYLYEVCCSVQDSRNEPGCTGTEADSDRSGNEKNPEGVLPEGNEKNQEGSGEGFDEGFIECFDEEEELQARSSNDQTWLLEQVYRFGFRPNYDLNLDLLGKWSKSIKDRNLDRILVEVDSLVNEKKSVRFVGFLNLYKAILQAQSGNVKYIQDLLKVRCRSSDLIDDALMDLCFSRQPDLKAYSFNPEPPSFDLEPEQVQPEPV